MENARKILGYSGVLWNTIGFVLGKCTESSSVARCLAEIYGLLVVGGKLTGNYLNMLHQRSWGRGVSRTLLLKPLTDKKNKHVVAAHEEEVL